MDASIANTISEYFKTKPVEKAWIFGSFSRNEEREDSDIDIAVVVDKVPGDYLNVFVIQFETKAVFTFVECNYDM